MSKFPTSHGIIDVPHSLRNSLISHWKLDEVSGTRFDAHGTNNLTDVNTVGSAAGKINLAADFIAANLEQLNIADNASLSMGNFDFTMAAWAKLDLKVTDRFIIAKRDGPLESQREYDMPWNPGSDRFEFRVCDGTASTAAVANTLGSPSTGTWYYIIGQYDSVNNLVGIMVNNGALDTTAQTTGAQDAGNSFRLGAAPGAGTYFDGLIDSVSVWKRLLTTTEKTKLYNGGNGLDYPFF